jgi:prevent-host-death family protein
VAKGKVNMEIAAGQFKAQCLKLMDEVQNRREEIIITKHGKPIAKLVPFEEAPVSVLGFLRNTVLTSGDIVSPIDETWEVDA